MYNYFLFSKTGNMDKELLSNMFYAAPELWYFIGGAVILLLCSLLFLFLLSLKLKQKNYFLRRDRERYAETLYASHDGYFAFIYPDEKVNDPRKYVTERCSRRLAVILGLEQGVKSSFDDVLKNFYKDDAKKILKYVGLLKEEGVAFEDYFLLKVSDKYIRLEGVRINGADGNIYCDMIWFRDVSFATNRIKTLEKEKSIIEQKYLLQQDMLDNLPFAVWLRNENLDISYCNKKFAEFIPDKTSNAIAEEHIEITGTGGESISRNIASKAHRSKKSSKAKVGIVVNGSRVAMEAVETPFYPEQNLEKTYSVGCLVNVNELDSLKRDLKQHQSAQLEILQALGTAFAVFDQDMKLQFHNQAFTSLWKLDTNWLKEQPSYPNFLDYIRENRLLPEVPDYKAYKSDEQKKFSQIIEPMSDLMHLPDGKTIRRMRAPYPMGGVVFAFEDISDRLATTSAYNALISVQNEILSGLSEGILIFGSSGRLNFYNDAYIKLWNAKEDFLSQEPTFDEILDSQQSFFSSDADWDSLKKGISANILNMTSKTLTLKRSKRSDLLLSVKNLSDGSLLIVYKNID